MRRIWLLLLISIVFISLSSAQDASTLGLGSSSSASSSSSSTGRSSDADCAAAAAAGAQMPSGCTSDGSYSSAGDSRQGFDSSATKLPELTARPDYVSPDRPPVNPSRRVKVQVPLRPHTEFEQIVSDTVGRTLPLFGQTLFEDVPSTFAPTDRMQVPGDYVVGPDDVLQIRIWGQLNADLRLVVDRSGQIYIPHVGQIPVAGIHYSELDEHIKREVMKYYHNFSLTVNIGKIRSVQIFVVGQARFPGTYTISSLSTMVNAVFTSGGPTPQGSLRDVQLQRDGKTIAHLDFYDLLVKGDKSTDVRLQSGDVLFFPPVGPLAAIAGSVNTPAIYEVKPGSTLADLIEFAGGLSTVADSSKVTVERIDNHKVRSVLEFPLDAESRSMALRDGDIVRVLSIVPRFENSVTLRGNVVNPGRYPWKPGMRVRDLIPNAQALLTRPYWMDRSKMTVGSSTEYPLQPMRPTGETNSSEDGTSAAGTAETQNASAEPRMTSRGEAGAMTELNSGNLGRQTQAGVAGFAQQRYGRTGPTSETLTADLHRASPEINWSYAIIQRVNPEDLSTKLLSFDLGKAVLAGDQSDNLLLEPDDIVTVFSQSDVSVPESARGRYIRIEGEVVRAGVYKVEPGETLPDVLKRAGGLTSNAYVYGTQMTRESARAEQQKSIDELARTFETEMVQAQAAGAPPQTALLDQIRNTRATGRIVLTLQPNANSIDSYPAITVEDNDRIVVPHRPATISVVGMVYNAGSFVFDSHRKTGDYLRLAGKGKPGADMKHAFVLRADGSVVPSKSVNGVLKGDKFAELRLYPGDQVVVPTKIPTGAFLRNLRDWSQISSQFALMGAALAVIQ